MPMMDYGLRAGTYYRVLKPGKYPWPTRNGSDPNRTFELLKDDILTKDPKTGTYTCHTGVMCLNIQIPDDAVELDSGKDVSLQGV